MSYHFGDDIQSSFLPIILIVGPSGSGKGTLSEKLAADFNLHHLSVGDRLRESARPPIAGVLALINRYSSKARRFRSTY